MKKFEYGDRVIISEARYSGERGRVYAQEKRPGRERKIYVEFNDGCGVAFLVRYVQKAK